MELPAIITNEFEIRLSAQWPETNFRIAIMPPGPTISLQTYQVDIFITVREYWYPA